MSLNIALAGNPNSGKTTLYNILTGSSQYVGNWPGVTVEKKEGKARGYKDVIITDLPGIYSLSPYTLEEVVTRNFLLNEKPDVIINLVDASNIERNLYLTTQLLELNIPIVIALNMIDVVEKNGDTIDTEKLSKDLGCKIISISALKNIGLKELVESAIDSAKNKIIPKVKLKFDPKLEEIFSKIENEISPYVNKSELRWYTIKVFERDEKIVESLNISKTVLSEIEKQIQLAENIFDDDAEGVITNERYSIIENFVKDSVVKKNNGPTTSDKIDHILTNRWLALPIFGLIMWLVYFVSVSSLGTIVTDWTNDVLFGEIIAPSVQNFLEGAGASAWIVGLVVDGIIGGVGSVLGFVPQMIILFTFLSFLEDCGYMARVAFIMDRIFRKFGLSGKSFIPMLVASGCGVPGIMASRTIENERDRRMTIIVTTFIPCGAKMPIIALMATALFPGKTWVAPFAYFLGMSMIVISGLILKKTSLFAGEPSPFVMELPQYHLPSPKNLFLHVWERASSFIIKAGTVIFIAVGVIWMLSNFGFENGKFGMVNANSSILAVLGGVIAPVFVPLGFGNWEATVSTITGFLAKEAVVGTFGVFIGINEATEADPTLISHISSLFTPMSALSFMIFNLLCAPCFAAIGAIKREMNDMRWTLIAIGYQTLLAYIVAFVFYQLGSVLFFGQPFGLGAILSIIIICFIIYLIVRPEKKKTVTKKVLAA